MAHNARPALDVLAAVALASVVFKGAEGITVTDAGGLLLFIMLTPHGRPIRAFYFSSIAFAAVILVGVITESMPTINALRLMGWAILVMAVRYWGFGPLGDMLGAADDADELGKATAICALLKGLGATGVLGLAVLMQGHPTLWECALVIAAWSALSAVSYLLVAFAWSRLTPEEKEALL